MFIVNKYKEVLFCFKANKCYWLNEIGVNVLIKFYCSWLEVAIILFFDIFVFVVIIDKFFYIINEFNIVIYEIFFQYSKV